MKARGWAISAVAVALAGATVVTAVDLRPESRQPPQRAAATPTATVERVDLVETRTVDGQIGYGAATPLPTVLGGTVTSLPVVGATLARGQRLYAVDNQPVLLLIGTLPAYRELAPGVEGRDVRQLEQNLRALGYHDFRVDDEYTSATARAVRRWQRDVGLMRTGVIELGQVVFWPRSLRVGSVEVSLGQTIATGDAVLSHTSTERNVTADLDLSTAGLARVGAAVQVSLPGRPTIPGRISGVSTEIVAASGSGSDGEDGTGQAAGGEPTVAVTVTVRDQTELGAITGAPVEVRLAGARRDDVLAVPVAALLALSEGGHGVEVVDGDARRIVAVTTGLFAGGLVEVSGPGIAEGTVIGTAAS